MSDKKREDYSNEERLSENEQRLEDFLDGLMDESERAAFLDEKPSAEIDSLMTKQTSIDESLRRMFSFGDPPEDQLAAIGLVLSSASLPKNDSAKISLPVAVVALAASIAFVGLSIWWYFGSNVDRPTDPFFQPTQLAKIYEDTVARGFEPYYECEDDDRFADIFESRQGLALALSAMPAGTKMLGLSYPGGISRDTTAMLCIADDNPVIVFVDRIESDRPELAESGHQEIFVHRQTKHNLVFYEVSPFNASRMIKYMVPADP